MACWALCQATVKLEAARGWVANDNGIVMAPVRLVISERRRMSVCLVELGTEGKGARGTMGDVQDDLATARLVGNDGHRQLARLEVVRMQRRVQHGKLR